MIDSMKLLPGPCGLALALLLAALPATAQVAARVQKIEVKHIGPAAASDELIKANIRVKVGDTYSRIGVDDDVRSLYGTGFFYNIRVVEEPVEGGVKVTYVMQGKPRLDEIKFEGNKKYSESKLLKTISSKKGEPLDERKLFTDSQAIQKLYQKAGLQKTQVKYVLNINENAGRGSATFEITESPRVLIYDVIFEGATAFKTSKLAKVIETRKRWWLSWITGSGVLKDDVFEEDKDKLAEFYRNEGYIDFEIKEVKFEQVDAKRMTIRLVLFEGSQYKVGTVQIKGNQIFPAEEILKGSPVEGRMKKPEMTTGKIFTPRGLNHDIEAVRDFYGAKGYIDTRVSAQKTPNTETGNIDLVFQVEERDKSFIEKIEIKGNIKTKDRVIRRELAVSPGETFDMVSVTLSKERLQNLNFFEKVDTQPEPTDVPNRKNLVVAVDEKNTGNLSVGAGFSSVDNLVGFIEVTQGNFDLFKPPYFTGGGQKGRLRASYGARRQDYVATFIEPWFLDRKLALSVDAYHRLTSFESTLYDTAQTGGRIGLEKALGSDFLRGSISYTAERVGIKNVATNASPELMGEAGLQFVSKVGLGLAYDTRRGGLIPTGGQRTDLTTEIAGGPLGGDSSFYKVELRTSWYFPGFIEGHLLELGARGGGVENYGNSTNVTIFNRFFLGGPRTLRGYRYYGVGPTDSFGESFGGNTYWMASAEYSIPIIDKLRFAAFYDIGKVYSSSWSLNPNGAKGERLFNDDVGIGLRINIPNLGPLRFDYGFPLTRDPRSSAGGKFNFDIGYTRDF